MFSRLRRTSAVAAAILTLAIPTTAALASPSRDRIASKRTQAAAAEAELQALGAKVEPAIERYNAAVVTLDHVKADITANQAAIGRISANLEYAHAQLTKRLQAEYRRGDQDPLVTALESGDLAELLQRTTLLKQAERGTADLALQLRSSKRELARRRASLARDRTRAVGLQRQAAAQKAAVAQAIAAQKSKLSSLHSEIKTMIAENARQQARLRQQALERAAAARTAASQADTSLPDPGIGGSGGGGGTSANPGGSAGGGAGTSSGGGSAAAPAPTSSGGGAAVAAALTQLGVKYVWGGMSPGAAFDCSGLTAWAWSKAGVSLDHYTGSQWNQGTRVSRDQLQPGDLVFFSGLGHEGMYIGAGQFIHAPHTGDVVKISSLSGYYASNYMGAVRPG